MSKGVQNEPEWLCCEVEVAAGAEVVLAVGFDDAGAAADCCLLVGLGFAAAPEYEGLAGL